MNDIVRLLTCTTACLVCGVSAVAFDGQTRAAADDTELRFWLQNMVWHHHYTTEELQQVTGLDAAELAAKLNQFQISDDTRPARPADRLLVLPYPGGRHPRIGFLDGAIDPQRETKLSVFCPWDDTSYAVLDVPEAIWSDLGLTYLAHTHIDTIWTKQGVTLPQQEWQRGADGSLTMERQLPNGIEFGTKVSPRQDHLRMKMWLTNGTDQSLSDLRVQNCVMLKGADGFDQQSSDNKRFMNGYAVAEAAEGGRWMITAWDPVHRAWANAPCPCLHSDPKFPDCAPGETKWLRGWFSFYQGDDIAAELARIEATGWRTHPLHHVTGNVVGSVTDDSGRRLPCRLYVQHLSTGDWHFATSTAVAGSAVEYRRQVSGTASMEHHTSLSADGFQLQLPPGRYRFRAERGKEYLPAEQVVEIGSEEARTEIRLVLKRFTSMAERGWYSGDTHVHRTMEELPNVVLAEDLNVAFPLNYWVRDSTGIPSASGPSWPAEPQYVDDTHVIYPVNTEYEIFTVNKRRHTQGAVFVLNHKTPLNLPAPPVRPVAEEARRQEALLDLDKHSWNWSMMIVPLMKVDLFELSNNHHWKTQFGFPKWTLQNAPVDWPEIETNEGGFTEAGWTHFGLETYYTLLNCGFRMRVTAGTASGVHPVPLGHGRVYVHCGDHFDYQNWIRHLDAGHSFVTQGPLPDIRFNGELPGTTWKSAASDNAVRVTGAIESLWPLKSVQLIRNGEIVRSIDAAPERTAEGVYLTRLEADVDLHGSGWVALRCFENLPDGKVSFAHTNPVFMDVPGMPLRPRRSRVEFLVRRMQEEVERNQGILDDAAVAEFREARQIYAELLKTAR
ncbi:MAG: CehA/McbA family metallohydrolase [Fuerstiella sp.]